MLTHKEIEQLRAAETLKNVMSNILLREEADLYGLSSLASVARVEVSITKEHVKFFISVLGDAQRKQQVMDLLQRQLKAIRFLIGKYYHSRKVPEISFILDESVEKTAKLDALMHSLKTTPSTTNNAE